MLRQQAQKMRFVDSHSQVYYDNFKPGLLRLRLLGIT